MGLIFLPLMFLVLWAIVIFPQQRRMRAHQALMAVLQEGDEVMTTSGIIGTITAIDDEVLHLEVSPGVRLRIVRAAIARRMTEPEPPADETAALEELDGARSDADNGSVGPLADSVVDVGEPAGAPAEGEQSGTDG